VYAGAPQLSSGHLDGSAAGWRPAEEADREEKPGDAPERDDGEVVPGDGAGRPRGDVGVEEGVEEMAGWEEVGEGEDAVRYLVFGDEDAREEVEREEQDVDDRRRRVL